MIKKIAGLVIISCVLSACASVDKTGMFNDDSYQYAREGVDLVIPDNLNSAQISSAYEVPEIESTNKPKQSVVTQKKVVAKKARKVKQKAARVQAKKPALPAGMTRIVIIDEELETPAVEVKRPVVTVPVVKPAPAPVIVPRVKPKPKLKVLKPKISNKKKIKARVEPVIETAPKAVTLPRVKTNRQFAIAKPKVSQQKKVKINSLDTRYWISTQHTAKQLAAVLQQFVKQQGLSITSSSVKRDLYATAWAAREDKPDVFERFLFKLRPGLQFNSSEIEVVELLSNNVSKDVDWNAESSVKARELDALKKLAKFVEEKNLRSRALLGKQNSQMHLKEHKGQLYLRINRNYVRTWAAIQQALLASNYQIQSRDSQRDAIRFTTPDSTESYILSLRNISGKDATAIFLSKDSAAALSKQQSKPIFENIIHYIY